MVRSKLAGVRNSNLTGSVRTCCFNLRFWIHPVFLGGLHSVVS